GRADVPAPRPQCPAVTGVAWFLYAMALLAAATVAVSVASFFGSSSAKDGPTATKATVAFIATPLFGLTASGLRRRRRWSLLAALSELVVLTAGLCTATVLIALYPPGPPGTDGAAYAFMGAVSWALTFTGFLLLAFLPSTDRAVGSPPAAWYP